MLFWSEHGPQEIDMHNEMPPKSTIMTSCYIFTLLCINFVCYILHPEYFMYLCTKRFTNSPAPSSSLTEKYNLYLPYTPPIWIHNHITGRDADPDLYHVPVRIQIPNPATKHIYTYCSISEKKKRKKDVLFGDVGQII